MDENGISFKSITESIDTSTSAVNWYFRHFGTRNCWAGITWSGAKAGPYSGHVGRLGQTVKKLDAKKIELARNSTLPKNLNLQRPNPGVRVKQNLSYKYLVYFNYSHHFEEECILPPITLQLHNVVFIHRWRGRMLWVAQYLQPTYPFLNVVSWSKTTIFRWGTSNYPLTD
jgi:hypothetical protein